MYMSLLLLDCFARVGWAHGGRENGAMAHQTLTVRFKVVMQMLKKETMQIFQSIIWNLAASAVTGIKCLLTVVTCSLKVM